MRQRLLHRWSPAPSGPSGFGITAPRFFHTIKLQVFFPIDAFGSRNPPMTNRTRTDSLLLAGFCAFLFFYGLGQFGLIGADEPRYAQVAREMLERHDWVTPVLYGHPWLEKPPLYYWCAMLAYKAAGVSDTAARLPSALISCLLTVFIYVWARRFRRGMRLDAALITASAVIIIGFGRGASTDMPLTAPFTAAMLSWYGWYVSRKRSWLLGFY